MGIEDLDLKILKEQNMPYFTALIRRFEKYTPVELVDFLYKSPNSKEFVLDFINATFCHPYDRKEFTDELQRRRAAKDISIEVEGALINGL